MQTFFILKNAPKSGLFGSELYTIRPACKGADHG